MAFCRHCGQALGSGDKFCGVCGKAVEQEVERKQSYDGEIHKCPNCGEVLASFLSNCPSCGCELRGIDSSNSVKELAKKIEELESKREKRTFVDVLRKKINKGELDPVDKQIISVIMNFPIPNTKEDIQEFMILASANMEVFSYGSEYDKAAQSAIANAWKVKHKQAIQKEKVLLEKEKKRKKLNFLNRIREWLR